MIVSGGQATVQLYRDKAQIRRQLDQTKLHLQQVDQQRLQLQHNNAATKQQLDQKIQEQQQLQEQIKDLQAAKAAKESQRIALAQSVAAAPAAASYVASGTVAGCGDNSYAQFIYQHESGCRLNATNSIGCVGIGQACPGSKLYAVCPDLNYACQNSFFTSYANASYGGWAGAYAFWQANSWW